MSAFQRSFYGEEPTFTNLFRLIDDFSAYSRDSQSAQDCRPVRQRLFNPRFDVRETETTFELHGDLPGVDRENLTIEFTEPQTLVVRGRVERKYTSNTAPVAAAEDTTMSGAVAEGADTSHQASVSDEETEAAKEKGEANVVAGAVKPQAPHRKERYLHKERAIGDFSRIFNFQIRVDENAVSANLDRGVLHITVPKAAKHETRRVNIN